MMFFQSARRCRLKRKHQTEEIFEMLNEQKKMMISLEQRVHRMAEQIKLSNSRLVQHVTRNVPPISPVDSNEQEARVDPQKSRSTSHSIPEALKQSLEVHEQQTSKRRTSEPIPAPQGEDLGADFWYGNFL